MMQKVIRQIQNEVAESRKHTTREVPRRQPFANAKDKMSESRHNLPGRETLCRHENIRYSAENKELIGDNEREVPSQVLFVG
jgi:hypothetical protein